jgi:hypothetical protein
MNRVTCARYLAERIRGAKYVELPGTDHFPWVGDTEAVLGEVEEFLTGVGHGPEPDRVLVTVMFRTSWARHGNGRGAGRRAVARAA